MASRLCPFCMRMAEDDTCPHCGKNVNYAGSPAHLPAGYVVSGKHPYVLGAALGQGGFGITYIALDMVTSQQVAIKEYYPTYCSTRANTSTVTAYSNQEEVYLKGKERFLDEARTLKSLSDLKSIVNVLDFFEANNTAYLVMEFLDGSSLKEYAAKNGKFPAQEFLKQMKPLMEDIHRMHERGVIHRDIAPDNIILLSDGQMKLIDFGAARSYLGDKSMTVVVKKGFAPVEQYMSKGSSSSTDVYALAATIYYCITGKVPPDSAERQYDNVPLKPPSELGADITHSQERAIFKALEILPKDRTQSAQDFVEKLTSKEPKSEKPKPESIHSDFPHWKKFPVILAAVVAILAVISGSVVLFNSTDDSTSNHLIQEKPTTELNPVVNSPHSETTIPVTAALPAEQKTFNIGVAIYQYHDNFMTLYRQEIEAYFKTLETDTVKYNITMVDSKNDMAEQTNQINNFITQGMDVIILNLVQTSSAEVLIDKVVSAGIPLILINREPLGDNGNESYKGIINNPGVCYVGADARQSGTCQGEIVLALDNKGDINGDGVVKYVMVIGDPENPDAQYRTEFSIKALTDAGVAVEALVENIGNWDQTKGQKIVAAALAQFGDEVEVVFCNNDGMALGAAAAIRAAGRVVGQDIYLLGIDALDECQEMVKAGTMTGTVLNDYIGQAHTTVDVAIKMLNGEPVENYYWIDYVAFTS